MPLPNMMGGLAGAMMPAANTINTMLPQGGGMPMNMQQGQQDQGLQEIIAAIQRDPENAQTYIELARQRFGVDLNEMMVGMM